MKPGDKVVCTDDSLNPQVDMELFPNWVKKDSTYTIRRMESTGTGHRVLLEELKNKVYYDSQLDGYLEAGFSANRFAMWDDYVLSKALSEAVEEDELIEEELSV